MRRGFRKLTDYLWDMYENAQKAQKFVEDYDFERFKRDEQVQYAVMRALEIIGEAATKIPPETRRMYSEIPWREISGMRNKLIHEYMGVDLRVVWRTIQEDLPMLQAKLQTMLRDFGEDVS